MSWDWAMEQEQTSSPGNTDPGNRREFQVRNDAPDPRAWHSDGEQHSHRKPGKVHRPAEGAATVVNFETIHIILGQTQCFEERPEGGLERKASVPIMMENSCLQECGQFCRIVQEEERVHDRAQQSDQVGNKEENTSPSNKQVRRAVDNRHEVEVCRRHRSNPQRDEAWSLQYNQGKTHLDKN